MSLKLKKPLVILHWSKLSNFKSATYYNPYTLQTIKAKKDPWKYFKANIQDKSWTLELLFIS